MIDFRMGAPPAETMQRAGSRSFLRKQEIRASVHGQDRTGPTVQRHQHRPAAADGEPRYSWRRFGVGENDRDDFSHRDMVFWLDF